MASNRFLAPAFPVPFHSVQPLNPPIAFHHPGYPSPRLSLLFVLPRVDPTGNQECPNGVHHRTALLACQIVAGNAFDGALYTDREGQHPAQTHPDGVLENDEYFFIVKNNYRLQYPVVPSFRDWTFPHGQVPDSWPTIYPEDYAAITRRCFLTNHANGLEEAHVVPREEADWFWREQMGQYVGMGGIDSGMNLIWLRADIHRVYDSHAFIIVPKKEILGPTDQQSPRSNYVVHCLSRYAGEFWNLYNNVPVQQIAHTSRELHFARFALAIIPLVEEFVLAGQARQVLRVKCGEPKSENLTGSELKQFYGRGMEEEEEGPYLSEVEDCREREEDWAM
ncbi:uncharacterized protein DNG_10273 [Cephalotrichum gorgonifer]|uniref:HNH nuclease domain-containing protein n=1 Tax=Cephalotrichum gorgonifer TaxID=2041049 RepID=A0AAE8N8Q8_9PEZI|nr:uncharacterized protein DNG_10273 [Cephalotrichum gorgonifer]